METARHYQERLTVPLRWWVQMTMLLASFWLAFIVSIPPFAAWGATGVLVLFSIGMLMWIGAARIEVREGFLYAGAAHISVRHLGNSQALSPEETRELMGVKADARAFLLTRPYLKTGVRVTITDPADPTPYWLIGTRRPKALVASLEKARREVVG